MGADGGFVQSFIAEVLANVRAYVGSLGGNGLVAYRMCQCVLLSNPHKNQVNINKVSFTYNPGCELDFVYCLDLAVYKFVHIHVKLCVCLILI